MNFFKKVKIIILLLYPFLSFSQVETFFNGILLDQSFDNVLEKIQKISKQTKHVSASEITFPLAKSKEDHLICSDVKTKKGLLKELILTFADSKLVYIEARGNVKAILEAPKNEEPIKYLHYEVYIKNKLFINAKDATAWILNDEGLHLNLFTWNNPYSSFSTIHKKKKSDQIPSFLTIGSSLEELKPVFKANSKFINMQKLDGSNPNADLQINCFGVFYLNFPRKVEARFGKNKLNVVWILTAKAEEQRIRKALIQQYGNPIFVNDKWEIFNDWQVGLRKDKPEVLLVKKEIGMSYKESFLKK